jgi:hypothetical protein
MRCFDTEARKLGFDDASLFDTAVTAKKWATLVEEFGDEIPMKESISALDALACISEPALTKVAQSRAKKVIKSIMLKTGQVDLPRASRILRIFGKVASVPELTPVMNDTYTHKAINAMFKRLEQLVSQPMSPDIYTGLLFGVSRVCASPLLHESSKLLHSPAGMESHASVLMHIYVSGVKLQPRNLVMLVRQIMTP